MNVNFELNNATSIEMRLSAVRLVDAMLTESAITTAQLHASARCETSEEDLEDSVERTRRVLLDAVTYLQEIDSHITPSVRPIPTFLTEIENVTESVSAILS